jgi:lactate dehydrogenase-like 2-hydroxyacid dehydrogenase
VRPAANGWHMGRSNEGVAGSGGATGRSIVAITRPNLPGDPAVRLSTVADVRVWPKPAPPTTDEVVALAAGATALLCIHTDSITDALLARLPSLQLVALASVGYDSVDLAAAARRNVVVTNTPGVLSEAVADATFGLILAARRRLVEADRFVRAGRWNEFSLTLMVGLDVHGATLGLIGYGGTGHAVAQRATGFGMTVLYYDRHRSDDQFATYTPLDELLRVSDIVSVHCSLTSQTRSLLGAAEFRSMKRTATFVNTARGAIVDQQALIEALREGWIGSAGLDVQQHEPNPHPDDPLLSLPNCVVLPHIASASAAARVALVKRAVENIEAVLAGRPPLNPVAVDTA